ncbi:MAG: SH3 domain-containing protein [Chloroflexi bacterium OHK40]
MPPRMHPNDWDRLFRPGAPRRGGPLRALANILLVGAAIGLLGGGAFFALSFGLDYARESAAATAVAIETSNARILTTRTARALAETATAAAVAAAPATPAAEPTAPVVIGRGSVLSGGNLRSEPQIDPATVIGQICPGDQIDFLEQRSGADGALWYRIRITATSGDCTPQRVTIGSLGWASSTLLSQPAP